MIYNERMSGMTSIEFEKTILKKVYFFNNKKMTEYGKNLQLTRIFLKKGFRVNLYPLMVSNFMKYIKKN